MLLFMLLASADFWRAFNIIFLVGVLVWLFIVIFVARANYKRTKNKEILAIIFVLVTWILDNVWQSVGFCSRLGQELPQNSLWLLISRAALLIVAAWAITNFMMVFYGRNVKHILQRWINSE